MTAAPGMFDPWAILAAAKSTSAAPEEPRKTFAELSQLPATGCESKNVDLPTAYPHFRNFCSFRSPELAASDFRGPEAIKRESQNSSLYSNNSELTHPSLGHQAVLPDTPAARGHSLARVAKAAKAGLSDEWRAGFVLLSRDVAPCPGLVRWARTYSAIRRFLDSDDATTAEEFGWSTLDLFGCHPVVGTIRVDCMGALVGRGQVTEVLRSCIRLGHLTHYRHPCPGPRVPVWDFASERRP